MACEPARARGACVCKGSDVTPRKRRGDPVQQCWFGEPCTVCRRREAPALTCPLRTYARVHVCTYVCMCVCRRRTARARGRVCMCVCCVCVRVLALKGPSIAGSRDRHTDRQTAARVGATPACAWWEDSALLQINIVSQSDSELRGLPLTPLLEINVLIETPWLAHSARRLWSVCLSPSRPSYGP